jgi:hypothetical protein
MSNVPYQLLDRSKQEIRLIVLQDTDSVDAGGLRGARSSLKCELIVTSLSLYKVEQSNYAAHKANEVRNALARTRLDEQSFSKHFYALSYVWGDPSATCDIEVNGQAAKIGANLYAALESIQKNTKHRFIWADALCINQSDNGEKSWQVQQMGAIYARARATISWLGLSSADSDLALQTLAEVDRKTLNYFWPIQQAMEGYPPVPRVRKNLERISRDAGLWTSVANLCARPYWSRIWIFQEMACARDRQFLCGNSVAKDIIRPIALLLAWSVWDQEARDKAFDLKCYQMVAAIQVFRFFGDYPSDAPIYLRPGTLYDMLLKLSSLDAGDPRDIIYAPLGIATDRQGLGVVPDYSEDLDHVFKKTACALLRKGCLEALISASMQTKNIPLPSWVPDWSAKLDGEIDRMYDAGKGCKQRESTLSGIPQLADQVTLDGYIVGKIANIHECCPVTALESRNPGPGEPTFTSWLKRAEAILFPPTGGDNSAQKVKNGKKFKGPHSTVAQLLSCPPGPQPVWSLFSDPYMRFYRSLESATSLKSLLSGLGSASGKADTELTRYVQRVLSHLGHGSRPYRMDSGHIGLSWNECDKLDDVVVVIPGASMPCVLRRMVTSTQSQTGRLYELIGITYVLGTMDGEFLKKKGAQDLQTFTLG